MKIEIKIFLNTVKLVCPQLSEKELEYFGDNLSVRSLKKNEYFIQSGHVQKEVGFLISGLIRSFYVNSKGNEKTVRFFEEYGYVTHYSSFITQQPSKYNFQCLEPSLLVLLPYETMQQLYTYSPLFERYGRLIAEEILKMQQHRIESFVFESAEQRYLSFIKENPGLFKRISISHLCSFLGIERQTLTRIRKKNSNS